jgi:hypothetical protein
MNKTVIGIVVAVVLVAAGGWYYIYKNGGSFMAAKPQMMQSMKELIASGVTQKCTFNEPQSNTSGTIYIAGGKVRGDFSSQTQAGAMSGHMISDGSTMHTWMDGMAQGFTSSFAMTEGAGTDTQQGLNPDKKTDYVCEKWSADETKFQVPTNITFTDVSAMMQGGAGNAGSMNPPSKSAQCNACDMAPEPQRTQCRQALSCR